MRLLVFMVVPHSGIDIGQSRVVLEVTNVLPFACLFVRLLRELLGVAVFVVEGLIAVVGAHEFFYVRLWLTNYNRNHHNTIWAGKMISKKAGTQ